MGAGGIIETPEGGCLALKPDVLLFGVQVASIFLVVLASLINLSLNVGNQQLWTVVLTGSLGYLMPNPKIKVINGRAVDSKKESGTASSHSSVDTEDSTSV